MSRRAGQLTEPVLVPVATAESYPLRDAARIEPEGPAVAGRRTGWALGLLTAAIVTLAVAPNTSQTEQRLLNGGALGTSVGVVGTAVTGGCIPCGAVVGFAVGAGLGHLYDTRQQTQDLPVLAWRFPRQPVGY